MTRSSIHADHSNKIYDDLAKAHQAIDSVRPLTIVSRMQPDAIRMRYYRGPLAIVCEENERVNCHRSVNRKSCTNATVDGLENLLERHSFRKIFLSDLMRLPIRCIEIHFSRVSHDAIQTARFITQDYRYSFDKTKIAPNTQLYKYILYRKTYGSESSKSIRECAQKCSSRSSRRKHRSHTF